MSPLEKHNSGFRCAFLSTLSPRVPGKRGRSPARQHPSIITDVGRYVQIQDWMETTAPPTFYAIEIWKRCFHSGNAWNALSPHFTIEIWNLNTSYCLLYFDIKQTFSISKSLPPPSQCLHWLRVHVMGVAIYYHLQEAYMWTVLS